MEIVLPWPDRVLHPNARPHWHTKAKAAKFAREQGYLLARMAGCTSASFAGYDGKLHLFIDYYAKTRNYPDADGCLSSSKSWIDGISDALGVNDRRFVFHPFVKDETHKGGKVCIRITKGTEISAIDRILK